jgi:gliding motility-associated-like protein
LKQKYFILSLLAFLLAFPAAFAQGETSIWYFGNKAGLDFSSGDAVPIFNGQVNAVEGCTTLSDAQGNLQFYTNGMTVWNKYHIPMANGTGLFGDFSSTQAAVIVQQPGSANLYYVFTTNPFETDGGLRYSIVDITANNGMGQVTAKNILLNNSVCEKIAVVRHSNGQDVWVVTHLWNSNAFFALKVTPSGISPMQVMSNVGSVVTADSDHANAIGYMKISADGSKIVTCHTFMNKAELFDFDTTTGHVSNARELCNDASVYGAEFSPDNSKLYLSTVEQKKIFQFDLNAANLADSKILVATLPQSPGALQLAPNGKIYIAMAETDKLSTINNPDQSGANCNLTVNNIDLGGRMCLLGLPSFNQSLLYTKVSADDLCTGSNTGFAFDAGFTPAALQWDFGDGSAVVNAFNPVHHYGAAGNYSVKVTAAYLGGSISRTKEITVTTAPIANQIATQTFCIDAGQMHMLSSNTVALLGNQPANQFTVAYFATLTDAEHCTNPLDNNYLLTAGSTTIYANIKSIVGGCSTIVHFVLTAFEKPNDSDTNDLSACDGLLRDGRATFDLDAKADEILAAQPAGCTVKFYTSQADAENQYNPIFGNYTNETESQTIYAHIKNGGDCSKIVGFNLLVNKCSNPEDFDIFPKFFTPNGDGFNDQWQTKASVGTPEFKIEIFDRYGRLLKTITETDNQWNGTYSGRDLPSDDYWFVLSGAQIQEYRGHFSLKR